MDIISLGARGDNVRTLQQRLTAAGYPVAIDGDFGPQTEAVVRQFQRDHGLIDDGTVGPKTHAALLGRDTGKYLGLDHIAEASKMLDVDTASVRAVLLVESRGNGFLADGRPVILYERHIMRRRLLANGYSRDAVAALAQRWPRLINTKAGGYQGGAAEHFRLQTARGIDAASALESCSWGLCQIMGYHWKRLGYSSVHELVLAMEQSEGEQLKAFVRFIQTDPALHDALKARDWAGFARIYNGPGYRKNSYDTRLAEAYAMRSEELAA